MLKKEMKLEHQLPHLLSRLGHTHVKATHGYPKLHACPNYHPLCPRSNCSINAKLFARKTKYTDLLTSKLRSFQTLNLDSIVFCSNSYGITVSKYDSLTALLKVKLVSLPQLELLAQLRG